MADVRDLMQGSMPDNSAMNPMGSQGMSYGSPMQSQPMPQESVLGGMAQPSQPQSNIPMASAPAQGMPVEPQTMPEPQQPMQSQVQQPPPTVGTFLDNLENITDKLFRNPFDSSEYLLLDDEGAPKVKVSLSTLGVPQDTIKVSSVQALGEGREGYGTQLMKLLVQAAESSGMKLQLTADPNLKYPHPSGVQKGLNKEQLIDWYKRLGFVNTPTYKDATNELYYDPATMDPPSEMDQEFKKFSSAEDYAWSQKKKEREFRDAHAAPSAEDTPPEQRLEEGGDFSLAEIKQGFMNVPKDFFDPQTGPKNYMYNTSLGKESLRVIREYLDGKKDTLTAYRTVPKDLKEDNFIDGDWITFNKQYATNHGESRFGENEYRIIEQEVDPKDVWWDGNDINEWGYDTNANWQNFIDTWNQSQQQQPEQTTTIDAQGQSIFRGGDISETISGKGNLGSGVYFAGTLDTAKKFANTPDTPILETTIPKNYNFATRNDELTFSQIQKLNEKLNLGLSKEELIDFKNPKDRNFIDFYEGLISPRLEDTEMTQSELGKIMEDVTGKQGIKEDYYGDMQYLLFNPSKIKTKQQLEEIWNQAQQPEQITTIDTLKASDNEAQRKTVENMLQRKAEGRDRDVEFVPVDELLKFRQYDRSTTPPGFKYSDMTVDELRADIAKNGIKEPLLLNYGAKDRIATLGEGNHRLMIAKELGINYIPVAVHGTQSKIENLDYEKAGYGKVKGREPDQFGYVPSDQKPSDIGIESIPYDIENKVKGEKNEKSKRPNAKKSR